MKRNSQIGKNFPDSRQQSRLVEGDQFEERFAVGMGRQKRYFGFNSKMGREWITKKNICFLETPGASFQDTSFYIKCLFEADRAIFINDGIYYYRTDNQGSSVKDNSKIFAIVEELKTLEERYIHTEKEKQIINSVKIDKYFWNYNRLDHESQSAFRKEFEKIIPIIQDRKYYCEIISKNMLKELYSDFNLDYPIDLEVKYFFSRITRRMRQKWLG